MILYFLKVKVLGLAITVSLNGIPVITDLEGLGLQQTLPINGWLKKENNKLEITLNEPTLKEPENEDANNQVLGEEVQVEVTLFEHESSSRVPKIAEVFAHFEWPQPNIPPTYPYSWSETIQTPFVNLPETLLWSQTEHITALSSNDKNAMFNTIQDLANLIQSKDLENAFKLMKYRYQDEALANGNTIDEMKVVVKEQWGMMLAIEGIALVPISFDQANFDLIGQQNVVYVSRTGESPIIEFEDREDEVSYGIEIYFSRINKNWVIIR